MQPQIEIPTGEISQICQKHKIRELALFGSALREDFKPSSDVDLLVTFEPDAQIGFLAFSKIQREFAGLFHRPVDLVSKNGLNPRIRQTVIADARVIYAA